MKLNKINVTNSIIYLAEHDLTIGVEFGGRVVNVDGNDIKLQIWDTGDVGTITYTTLYFLLICNVSIFKNECSRPRKFQVDHSVIL